MTENHPLRHRLRPALAAALLLGLTAAPAAAQDLQRQIYDARDRVMPALVHIEPILEVYRMGERGRMAVTGSGVIFSADGYVLTNDHVVENATSVKCTLSNQEEVKADLIGRDPLTDLAVLKLRGQRPDGWPHADLGNSDALQAGQYVVAMGSPLGLSRSLSVGVISSLNRYIPESQLPGGSATGIYNTWIQTDAAINPGNSGGPLVALDGRVIGVNARAVTVFGENIGFAIPINLAREVARSIMESGEVTRAWIGVHWQSVRPLSSFFGLGESRGVLVGDVVRGSPADSAGLRAGDIVLEYDGKPVRVWFDEELPEFQKRVADSPVNESIPLRLLRGGREQAVSVLTRRRAKTEGDQNEHPEWGFTVRELTEQIARQLNLPEETGVLVSGIKPGSFAAEAGLLPRDLIVRIDNIDVTDLGHWSQLYQQAVDEGRQQVLLTVKRGTANYFHVIRPTYTGTSRRSSDETEPKEGRSS